MNDFNNSVLKKQFFDREIVLDLKSMYVCLGTLVGEDHRYLVLSHADVHDLRETNTTREKYVLDSKIHGIRPNREKVLINLDEIVGISLLADVIA